VRVASSIRVIPCRSIIAIFGIVLLVALHCVAQKPKPKQQRGLTDDNVKSDGQLSLGSYFALVIGNNDYRYVPKLKTAVSDAKAVAQTLQDNFGFARYISANADVLAKRPPITSLLLLNATRSDIIQALNYYRRNLPENSSLLIYYAGHGHKDRGGTERAYWLPVDADNDNDVNWISASTITEEISAIRSPHVLVISDSCYSGELTRNAPIAILPSERNAYLRRMLESPSRTLMASGRDEPVADTGTGGHSKFAYVLLESLRRIEEDRFTAGDLFQRYIQSWVAGGSNQVPQYSIIQNSGHAYGDFVFARSRKTWLGSPLPGPGPDTVTKPASELDGTTTASTSTTGPITHYTEADNNAIKDVLLRYQEAYNMRDAEALWKVWPNPTPKTKQAIEAAFIGASSIKMNLQLGTPEVSADGLNATVRGQFSQQYISRVAGAQPLRQDDIKFTLSKNNGQWTIAEIK
jgi:Caspase domain